MGSGRRPRGGKKEARPTSANNPRLEQRNHGAWAHRTLRRDPLHRAHPQDRRLPRGTRDGASHHCRWKGEPSNRPAPDPRPRPRARTRPRAGPWTRLELLPTETHGEYQRRAAQAAGRAHIIALAAVYDDDGAPAKRMGMDGPGAAQKPWKARGEGGTEREGSTTDRAGWEGPARSAWLPPAAPADVAASAAGPDADEDAKG